MNASSPASRGLSLLGNVGSIFCICTTILQLSNWLGDNVDATTRAIFVFGISTALFLSQVIIALMTQAKQAGLPAWVFYVSLTFVCVTELSSISISKMAFHGNLLASAEQQKSGSEESQFIRDNISRIARQLDVLERQYATTDSTTPTNRRQITVEIETVTKRLQNEQRALRNVDSGTAEQAMKDLPFGMSLSALSLAMGLILSGLPASNSILQGALAYRGNLPGRTSPRPSSPKQGPMETMRKKAAAAMEA